MNEPLGEQINRFVADTLSALVKRKDTDLRAAFDAWNIPGLIDNACLIKYIGDETKVEYDAWGALTLVEPGYIIVADQRQYGEHPKSQDQPIRNRFARVHHGQWFNVALLHPDEAVKTSKEWMNDE